MRQPAALVVGIVIVGVGVGVGGVGPVVAQAPVLTVVEPRQDAVFAAQSVTVVFQTSGFPVGPASVPVEQARRQPEANPPGEGHVHLQLDLFPLVIWDQAAPYTFSQVPPGRHQLRVELVAADHSPLSPPVVQQVAFQTLPAGLIAAAPGALPRAGEEPALYRAASYALVGLVGVALMAAGLRWRLQRSWTAADRRRGVRPALREEGESRC